jgi:5-methylcytosine-specific restriction endonuclease McrA
VRPEKIPPDVDPCHGAFRIAPDRRSERVGAVTRRMSLTRRARIFAEHGGVCHICSQPIDGIRERWDVEHVIPYALTRDDTDENLRPAHARCHAGKTKADVTVIAKAKRVAAKHQGAKPPSRRPIGDERFRKKLDGSVVLKTRD